MICCGKMREAHFPTTYHLSGERRRREQVMMLRSDTRVRKVLSMKIVALYDIHGNLPALDAVLKEVEHENPDVILVGGDIVTGPMPRATLERLLAPGDRVHYIRGNCEREVVAAFDRILPFAQEWAMLSSK